MRHKAKELRLKFGLTQDDVAQGTGTTKEYYGLIENGKRCGTVPYWLCYRAFYEKLGAGLTDSEFIAIVKEGVTFESESKLHKKRNRLCAVAAHVSASNEK